MKNWFLLFMFLILFIASLFSAGETFATPLTYGDEIIRPLKWPNNSTLNVYIQQDPNNNGRDQLAKEGVERWKPIMTARGITINVVIGNPPAGTENEVVYQWKPENFAFGGLSPLELGVNDGMAGAGYSRTRLLIGKAFLHERLPFNTDNEKNYLRNLAEHEMTHVLGFADDGAGSVMDHGQDGAARAFNARDTRELNLLYGTGNTGGANAPMGMGFNSDGGADQGFYKYHFVFQPANLIPDPDDSEHVSLINLGIDPSFVTGVDLPPGWISLISSGVVSPDDPFFDDYMEDGAGDPPPWDPLNLFSYIAFRTSFEEALLDGLPEGFDPGLTLDNFEFDITVYTKRGLVDVQIPVWAGGELQYLVGPGVLIPEPLSLFLLAAGIAALFLKRIN